MTEHFRVLLCSGVSNFNTSASLDGETALLHPLPDKQSELKCRFMEENSRVASTGERLMCPTVPRGRRRLGLASSSQLVFAAAEKKNPKRQTDTKQLT